MKKYQLTGRSGISCVLTYAEGVLRGIDFGENSTEPSFFVWIAEFLFFEQDLANVCKQAKSTFAEVIDFVPTFECFWERYNYKFDRKRAEDKWNKLKEADKIAAIRYIDTYKNELRRTGVAQMYAKTYLQNQVWKIK